MTRPGPLLLLLLTILGAAPAFAQDRYRSLARDLDDAALLEPLAARSLATLWSGIRVLVPETQHPALIDPAVAAARRMLSRPESAAALSDLLTLHEGSEVVPLLDAFVRAAENPGSAASNLERLSLVPSAAERAGIPQLGALFSDVMAAGEPAVAAKGARRLAGLPPETWASIDRIALGAVERGLFPRAARFVTTGSGPALGLEEPRKAIPPMLCFLSGENRPVLAEAAAWLENYSAHAAQPELAVASLQWAAQQLDEPATQDFLSKSLAYGRLPQIQRALVAGIGTGAVRETVLDYADFFAGTDRRVRVDPDTWKTATAGDGDESHAPGLSGLDFLKLSALTLFTVNRLDDVPSEPRPNGLKQSLADELLDYFDYQLTITGTKATISPLFDVVREFLSPREDRAILVAQVRDFARHMTANDPEPLLRAAKIWLACDTGAPSVKALSALMDSRTQNGDLRILTPVLRAFSAEPAKPLVPLVAGGGGILRDALDSAPIAVAALEHEQKIRVLSKLAVELSAGKGPLLAGLEPLARGLLREASVFRKALSWQTEQRIVIQREFFLAVLKPDASGASDFTRAAVVLARWGAYRNPVSGRPLTADAGLVSMEGIRNGLAGTLLDAGVAIRKKRGDQGVQRLLDLLKESLGSTGSSSPKNPRRESAR